MQNHGVERLYRSYNGGLSEHIQAQLLEDIEASGGIYSNEDFQDIYNKRTEIYGQVGSERRQQVKNKISYWRKIPLEDYFLVLSNFKVEVNSDNYPNNGRNIRITSPHLTPSPSTKMAPRRGYATRSVTAQSKIRTDVEVITIDVDVDNPERNREFFIMKFQNVMHDNILYNGFEVSLFGVDLRDTRNTAYYDAAIDSDENSLVVTCPATPYFYLHEHQKALGMERTLGTHVQEAENAHRVQRALLEDSPDKNIREYHLVFPSDAPILSSELVVTSNRVPVKNTVVPTDSFMLEGMAKSCARVHDILSWTVLLQEPEIRRLDKQPKGVEGTMGTRLARSEQLAAEYAAYMAHQGSSKASARAKKAAASTPFPDYASSSGNQDESDVDMAEKNIR